MALEKNQWQMKIYMSSSVGRGKGVSEVLLSSVLMAPVGRGVDICSMLIDIIDPLCIPIAPVGGEGCGGRLQPSLSQTQ